MKEIGDTRQAAALLGASASDSGLICASQSRIVDWVAVLPWAVSAVASAVCTALAYNYDGQSGMMGQGLNRRVREWVRASKTNLLVYFVLLLVLFRGTWLVIYAFGGVTNNP